MPSRSNSNDFGSPQASLRSRIARAGAWMLGLLAAVFTARAHAVIGATARQER